MWPVTSWPFGMIKQLVHSEHVQFPCLAVIRGLHVAWWQIKHRPKMEKYWKMKTTTEPRRLEVQPKFKTKWWQNTSKYKKNEWNRCSSWGSATSSMNFRVPIYLATAPAEPKIQHPTPWQLHPACDSSRSPAFNACETERFTNLVYLILYHKKWRYFDFGENQSSN